jgi:NADH:ubiquinone oxidoreductase subunit 2 (subunit N)
MTTSLKLNLSTPRAERHDFRPDVLPLKPPGSAVSDKARLRPRPRPETLASRVSQVPFFARFAVINLVGVALLAAAWAEGLLLKPYRADASGMCYLITALFLAALVAVARQDWQTVRWAGNALVYLGMVGTVLGLIMTVSDLSVDKAQSFESFKAIVTAIYVGAGIALYTNLLACIGYLWLGTNAHLLARQEV